jgi:polyphosphate kinase 2 (PPK2 family)
MLDRTDTSYAPWTVVEADDKLYARVKVLETVNAAIERGLLNAGIKIADPE